MKWWRRRKCRPELVCAADLQQESRRRLATPSGASLGALPAPASAGWQATGLPIHPDTEREREEQGSAEKILAAGTH